MASSTPRPEPSISDIDKLAYCPLCEKPYNSPVNLIGCSHVYCEPCILDRFGDKDIVACPMVNCGKKCKRSQLKRDERSEQLVALFKARWEEKERMNTTEIKCQLCEKKAAKWACYRCNKYLCNGLCAETHRTLEDLKDHKITSIDEIKQQKINALETVKSRLEPAKTVCSKKLDAMQKQVKCINQTLSNSIKSVTESEEIWITLIKQLHTEIRKEIKDKTNALLESLGCEQESVSSFQTSISQEITKYETLIGENKTRDLLNDETYNTLIQNGKSYGEQLESIKRISVASTVPTFQCMDTANGNDVFEQMSQAFRGQITETKHVTEASIVKRKHSTKRRPMLTQKSADSPHLGSLRSMSKEKNLVVQNMHTFQNETPPKRIKCIDSDLYLIEKGGKIRILTITGSNIKSRDITVHQYQREYKSATKQERIEYYSQSVAKVKAGIVVAIGRPMNPDQRMASAGLALVNSEGAVQIEIEEGSFIDVYTDSGVVYGLTNPDEAHSHLPEVHVFNHHRHKWTKIKTISLDHMATRLVVAHAKCIYTSFNSDSVHKYDIESGTHVEQIQLTKRPKTAGASSEQFTRLNFRQTEDTGRSNMHSVMLCFADPQSNTFVVNYTGNSLHCVTVKGHYHEFHPTLDLKGPWDGSMDDDGNIWIIASEASSFALYRICSVSNK